MSDRVHVRNESVANYEVPAAGAEATCFDDGPGAQILRFIDDDGRLKFVKDDQYCRNGPRAKGSLRSILNFTMGTPPNGTFEVAAKALPFLSPASLAMAATRPLAVPLAARALSPWERAMAEVIEKDNVLKLGIGIHATILTAWTGVGNQVRELWRNYYAAQDSHVDWQGTTHPEDARLSGHENVSLRTMDPALIE